MRRLCDKYGIVLIADEVQTGFTRTGKMFALEHYKVEADIVTTAKSLAGGLPLSAITGTAEIMDSVHVGGLGGTYGGNPLACRAALAVLDIIEKENLAAKSAQLGKRLKAKLEEFKARYPIIGEVRGLGSMLAIELVKDLKTKEPAAEEAKALTTYCYQNGLIILDCGTLGNNIRILMPVTITDEQIDKGLAILEAGLKHVSA
jgi:4-aminobutyrate aminotransferase/(S)-3-amino-2-methylpropionate transaminase